MAGGDVCWGEVHVHQGLASDGVLILLTILPLSQEKDKDMGNVSKAMLPCKQYIPFSIKELKRIKCKCKAQMIEYWCKCKKKHK